MTLSTYEPSSLEIYLTLGLGMTVFSPYYRSFAENLHLRGDENVLDYGSGSGVCSRHLAARLKRSGHLACVDVSSGWLEVIRKTLRRYPNVSYHLGRIYELAIPNSSFDMAVCHFVLHDLPASERPSVVDALARKLKPGGRLLLREPQGQGLTPAELDQLTAAAGLRTSIFSARKIVIGAVYDATYTK